MNSLQIIGLAPEPVPSMEEVVSAAKAKAEQIKAEKNLSEIGVFVTIMNEGDYVVAFFKHPSRLQKAAMLDKTFKEGAMSTAAEMLPSVLLPEYFDKRILEENPVYDKLFLGACAALINVVRASVNGAEEQKKS